MFHLWGSPNVDLFATRGNANSDFCVSSTGPPGSGSGCSLPAVTGPVGVHLPFFSAPHQGPVLTASTLSPASPWGSDLACLALVPGLSWNCPAVAGKETVLRLPWSDSFPWTKAAPHLEAIRISLGEAVFSWQTAESIAAPRGLSIKSVFAKEWHTFCNWCSGWETAPFSSDSRVPSYLFQER